MEDVSGAYHRGGRAVAHNLEFDAGIILNELARCGMLEACATWKRIAGDGFCTMDYEVGRWVRLCCGDEVGPPTAKHCLGLKDLSTRLLSESQALLRRHHNAGVDAQLARWVYMSLLRRSKRVDLERATPQICEEIKPQSIPLREQMAEEDYNRAHLSPSQRM
eukprot:1916032-Karenia_brevis.AAC.1